MTEAWRRAAAWGACSIAIGAFVLRAVIPAANDPYTVGFTTCYAEARILLENPRELHRVYDDAWFQARIDRLLGRHVKEIAHAQPPTMSLLLLPLAWLPPPEARAAWIWLNAVLWVLGLAVLASGLGLGRVLGIPPVVWLTALSTGYRPMLENLGRGQGYVLSFFLLSLALHGLLKSNRRRRSLAGAPLGLAFVLKSAGLWLYPLLAAARQWRTLAVAVGAALTVVVVFSARTGWQIWPIYLHDAFRWLAAEPSNHVTAYQTLQSLTGHLFVYEETWNARPLANLPWLAKAVAFLILGAGFAISVRLHRLNGKRLEERALTLALFAALIAPAAPIGEGYHYVQTFPALLIAWWWAVRAHASLMSRLVLAGCTGLLLAPPAYYNSPHLQDGWTALLAYPMVYGAFGLWAWLASALARMKAARAGGGGVSGQRGVQGIELLGERTEAEIALESPPDRFRETCDLLRTERQDPARQGAGIPRWEEEAVLSAISHFHEGRNPRHHRDHTAGHRFEHGEAAELPSARL